MSSVLVAIPSLLVGGTEIQTLRLVEALNQGGHHVVTVCYFEYDFNMVQQFKQAGSKVVCLSAYGNRPEGIKAQRKFLKEGLKRVVAEYRPKIAHVQYMAPGAIPIMILHQLGIKNIIATLHTDANIYKNLRLIHFLQKHIVTAFTCVTATAEQNFFGSHQFYTPELAICKHNHFTLYNSLPQNSSSTIRISESSSRIGFVGRLESIKGADLLLPAFAELMKQNPEATLRIVGDGSLRNKMEQQQKDLSIPNDKVTWVGRVEHEKLEEQYNQMDIVWMPSRSEGFGLSAIEAMSFRKPVIATNTGGLKEIITDGKDGLLFENEDIHALVIKTCDLLKNKELIAAISTNAQQRSCDFSFEKYQSNINNLYSKLK